MHLCVVRLQIICFREASRTAPMWSWHDACSELPAALHVFLVEYLSGLLLGWSKFALIFAAHRCCRKPRQTDYNKLVPLVWIPVISLRESTSEVHTGYSGAYAHCGSF